MEFALIIDGPDAPAPAPRCAAVASETGIGVYVPAMRAIVRPDYDGLRAALPARLRRYAGQFPSLWYDKRARHENGRTQPALPYLELHNARGDRVATVYCALCE